jgi:cytochrome P450
MADYDAIDFFTDPSVVDDTPAFLAHLRAQCPVLRERFHGAYMVTGHDAAMEVLAQKSASFSSAVAVTGPIPPLPFAPEGDDIAAQLAAHREQMPWTDHLATMDAPVHAANRALLTQLLTHSRLKANEDYVRGLVVQLVDQVIARGGCEITRDFAHALSTLVICDLLGVPEGDRQDLITLLGLPPTQMEGDAAHKVGSDPLGHLHERFRAYLLERRARPQGDMMSELANSRYRDGSTPDIALLTRLTCFLFGAGQDTSARLLAFCFRVLGDRPDIQAQVRADPARIPDFIEEVLRLENPVKTLSRVAIKPVTVGGVGIAAGSVVTVNVGGANRDPAHFSHPEDFDLDRPELRDHISFSRGSHACLGAPLARMEVREALGEFLRRTRDIRISEAHHGPAEARRYAYEPTYLLQGLQALHVEWE